MKFLIKFSEEVVRCRPLICLAAVHDIYVRHCFFSFLVFFFFNLFSGKIGQFPMTFVSHVLSGVGITSPVRKHMPSSCISKSVSQNGQFVHVSGMCSAATTKPCSSNPTIIFYPSILCVMLLSFIADIAICIRIASSSDISTSSCGLIIISSLVGKILCFCTKHLKKKSCSSFHVSQ